MSQITLFLRRQEPAVVLGNVAPAVFEALGITDWEERDSSNYPPDDHYFVGHCANAEVIVCDADENRMPDFPVHVLVDEANWMKGGNSMSLDAPTIAKTLVTCGFAVFIPSDRWAENDWNGDGDLFPISSK